MAEDMIPPEGAAYIRVGRKGHMAIVDADMVETLSKLSWIYSGGYAMHRQRGVKTIWMHRLINGTPDGMETDHINHDPLDNRRANLRTATRFENSWNTRRKSKGVTRRSYGYIARITANGRNFYIGCFKTRSEAEAAYDNYARGLHREFAFLNRL